MTNLFIPSDLHSLLKLLKYNDMLKEIKYSIDHDSVKATVVDNFNNNYIYINGFAHHYNFKRRNSVILEVER